MIPVNFYLNTKIMYYTLTKNNKTLLVSENREEIEEVFHQEGGYDNNCSVTETTIKFQDGQNKIKDRFIHIL